MCYTYGPCKLSPSHAIIAIIIIIISIIITIPCTHKSKAHVFVCSCVPERLTHTHTRFPRKPLHAHACMPLLITVDKLDICVIWYGVITLPSARACHLESAIETIKSAGGPVARTCHFGDGGRPQNRKCYAISHVTPPTAVHTWVWFA